MSKNLSDLTGKKGLEVNLFEQVGRIAKENGSLEKNDLEELANEFLVGKANVYGTASFYDFSRPENRNKKIYVCNGSACLTAGSQPALEVSIKERFAADEIGQMCCLGRCYENSAFHYQGYNYSGKDIEQLDAILNEPKSISKSYQSLSFRTKVLIDGNYDLLHFKNILASVLKNSPEKMLDELEVSLLRGRGGAGFPMSFKLDACRKADGKHKFIVCNADEGDPGAYSDRYLLEENPFSVLFGMVIAGYTAGADQGVVYIRAEYPESIRRIEQAVVEMQAANCCGEAILGTSYSFHFKVISALGAYICGEETALINSIEGQRPEVRVRPPFPAQKGLFNMPTVVNNVETLACVPWIANHSGEAFASIGRGRSTGTKLVSLDGYFNRPGIYEVDYGTPLQTVIDELGQGFRVPIKALHIGGPLGGLVPIDKVKMLTIDFESFAENGFLLGHASILCVPEDYPIINYLEHLFEFTAHESCGKCFPCRLGATRGKELMHKARTESYKIEEELLLDLIETMQLGSLCALGGGVPLPVKNALTYFKAELAPYLISKSKNV